MDQLLAEEEDEFRRLSRKKEKRKEKKKKRKQNNQSLSSKDSSDTSHSVGKNQHQRKHSASSCKVNDLIFKTKNTLHEVENNSDEDIDTISNPNSASDGTDEELNSTGMSRSNKISPAENHKGRRHIDKAAEIQLLSLMGWNAPSSTSSSSFLCNSDGHNPEEEFDDENKIPEDDIIFWKRNQSKLVTRRLEQRQKLQDKFNAFVLRNNS